MKKGFTLIELLTVIVILGVIAAIAVPKILDTINSSRIKSCKEQVNMIESAAKRWGTENTFDIESNTTITVKDLQNQGYLTNDDIINPIKKVSMENDTITVSYNSKTNQYSYKMADVCS